MDRDQQRVIGILLLIVGAVFYFHSSVYQSYYSHRNDFAHLYLGGYIADRGGNFFDFNLIWNAKNYLHIPTGLNPFVYPPFFAILLIPLSHFSYNNAWTLFFVLSHAAYFFSLALIVRSFRREEESAWLWWGGLMALSACFIPLPKTYSAGQMNTFMLLILSGGWFLWQRKREAAAGAVIGLGAAIKITPAILLLYFLWKGRWRAAAGGFVVIGLSIIISYSCFGAEIHRSFLREARQMSYGSSTWSNLPPPYDRFNQHYHVEPHNQAPSALWHRLLTNNPSTQGAANSPRTAKAFSYLTALAILAALAWGNKLGSGECRIEEYSLWILGMLLLPSLLWDHYLAQAILPIAAAWRLALDGRSRGLVLLGLSIAIMAIPFLHDHPLYKEGWMTLFMSLKLFALLLLGIYFFLNLPNRNAKGKFPCDEYPDFE
ncbi:MAG: glycosyltransferase family 87 protein [Candidatus Omnitrophota bacterium]